jgi:hypothetical protein
MQQALSVIGVVVGLQDAAQRTRWKTLGKIGQPTVDQPALITTLDQGAAR